MRNIVPVTRKEKILNSIAEGKKVTFTPSTREEVFLSNLVSGKGYTTQTEEINIVDEQSAEPINMDGSDLATWGFNVSEQVILQDISDISMSFTSDGKEYSFDLKSNNNYYSDNSGTIALVLGRSSETPNYNSIIGVIDQSSDLNNELKGKRLTKLKIVSLKTEITVDTTFANAVSRAVDNQIGNVVEIDLRKYKASQTFDQIQESDKNYCRLINSYRVPDSMIVPLVYDYLNDESAYTATFVIGDSEGGKQAISVISFSILENNEIVENSMSTDEYVDAHRMYYDSLPFVIRDNYAAEDVIDGLLRSSLNKTPDTILYIKNSNYTDSRQWSQYKYAYDVYHYAKTEWAECTTIGGRNPDENVPMRAHYIYFTNGMGGVVKATCFLNYNNRYAYVTIDYDND